MEGKTKTFDKAVASLIGTIIGVGIFGLPYAISRAGFFIGVFWFIILGLAVMAINLVYGCIASNTPGRHRLVGFVRTYLGGKARIIATVSVVLGMYAALLAYIIIGGEFLNTILGEIIGGSPFLYSLIFFSIMAILVYGGLKAISKVEIIMVGVLIFIVGVIFVVGSLYIKPANLSYVHWHNFFVPYGVLLFAMGGLSAIPEMRDILGRQKKSLKKAIIFGTAIPILVMFFFALIIVGTTGLSTSEESIAGLAGIMGERVVVLGSLLGLLSVSTSFLILGVNLKEMFMYDYKLNKLVAWVLSVVIPFAVFLSGSRSFISVIGFSGSVMGGINGILVLLMYLAFVKKAKMSSSYSLNIPKIIIYILIMIFLAGMGYEISSLI